MAAKIKANEGFIIQISITLTLNEGTCKMIFNLLYMWFRTCEKKLVVEKYGCNKFL